MKISFAVGNGESRQGFDLSSVSDVGPIYGCNYIFQDCHVDNLIACDRAVVDKILRSGYNSRCNFYTRERWYTQFNQPPYTKVFPELVSEGDQKWQKSDHWGSGLYAAYIACVDQADVVVMIGYDLNGFQEKENNNVYKKLSIPGTDAAGQKPIDASFWIKQFTQLFTWFPDVTFSFINHDDWMYPAEWDRFENWTIDNYEVLQQFLEDNKL